MTQLETQPRFTADHQDIEISQAQEQADLLSYTEELAKRLPAFAEKVSSIPKGQPGSIQWAKEVGQYWRSARETQNISRYGLASRMDIHVNTIRFLELGIVEVKDLPALVEPLSQAIGDPDLYTAFSQRYGVPQTPSAQRQG